MNYVYTCVFWIGGVAHGSCIATNYLMDTLLHIRILIYNYAIIYIIKKKFSPGSATAYECTEKRNITNAHNDYKLSN